MGSRIFSCVQCSGLFCKDNEMTRWANCFPSEFKLLHYHGVPFYFRLLQGFLTVMPLHIFSSPSLSFAQLSATCPSNLTAGTVFSNTRLQPTLFCDTKWYRALLNACFHGLLHTQSFSIHVDHRWVHTYKQSRLHNAMEFRKIKVQGCM